MIIKCSDVDKIDNSNLIQYVNRFDHKNIINASAGTHHYKLLSYLSMNINNALIYEFGTHHGTSSLVLSVNKSNKIVTWDIRSDHYGIIPQPENVERKIGNIFDLTQENEMLESNLIFVDVDHLGVFEWKVYCFLSDNNYKGVLLLDDIWYNQEMIKFWNKIVHKKYDITGIGHHNAESLISGYGAGTGLVDFNNSIQIVE